MFWLKLLGVILGSFAAAILLGIRLIYAFKDSVHDYYSVPTNRNTDATVDLKNTVHELEEQIKISIRDQKADHHKIAHMIGKMHIDQKRINSHEKRLNKHRGEITVLEKIENKKKESR